MSAALTASQLFDVAGWVVVVTGGGTGLGLLAATTLLANGAARVYITGRRAEVLRHAAETHSQADGARGELVPVPCDVSDKADIERLVAAVRARDTFVNLLVNNASVGGVKNDFDEAESVEDIASTLFATDLHTWSEALHLNTSSMFFAAAAFLPLLVAARGPFPSPGSILNISSMSGLTKQSQGGQFPYNTAKAGTIALTQQLAYEFRRPGLGVRVNTLAPGFFPSEMTPAHLFAGSAEQVRARWGVPIGRQGRAAEYAQAVLALAVNDYMNGSTVLVDGGWLLEQS